MSPRRITDADGSTFGTTLASGVSGRLIGVCSRSETELIWSIGVCTATE